MLAAHIATAERQCLADPRCGPLLNRPEATMLCRRSRSQERLKLLLGQCCCLAVALVFHSS